VFQAEPLAQSQLRTGLRSSQLDAVFWLKKPFVLVGEGRADHLKSPVALHLCTGSRKDSFRDVQNFVTLADKCNHFRCSLETIARIRIHSAVRINATALNCVICWYSIGRPDNVEARLSAKILVR